MLAFFRRIVNSRVGMIITFGVLILIALAFALGDVTGLNGSTALGGGSVARIGSETIGSAELRRSVEEQLENARQQSPQANMTDLIAAGGFEATLEREINELAMEEYGHKVGMRIGKKLVDSQLASFPALQGPNGKFSQTLYESLLAQRKLTDKSVRTDIARGLIAQHLVLATGGATQMPMQLALPYANLLLEQRKGQVAFVPTGAMAKGAEPTDAEVQTWYKRNIARYSLPERRVARYAFVTPAFVQARAAPSADEIRQAYQADAAKYRPTEKRTITQVTVLDQKAADALAAKVKAGTGLAEAARGAGLESRTLTGVVKTGYVAQASAAAADAVFAAQKGAVVGPVRASLGFIVAKVDAIEQVAGKSLAEATPEITTALTQQKTTQALADLQDAIGGALDKDSNFSEVVTDQKLQAQVTPALTAQGVNPDDRAYKPDPALAQVVGAAFAAAEGDGPTVVQTGQDGSFAVVALERVVRAAPRPLASVRAQVAGDFMIDRSRKAARQIAAGIMAKAGKGGAPLAKATAEAGVKLPPVQPVSIPRSALAANPQGVPPEVALLFSMAAGTAKLQEAPGGAGWYIVRLDTIIPGDAAKRPEVVAATRREIGGMLGREYVQQFTNAVRKDVKVTKNPAAIAAVKAALTGQGGSNQ